MGNSTKKCVDCGKTFDPEFGTSGAYCVECSVSMVNRNTQRLMEYEFSKKQLEKALAAMYNLETEFDDVIKCIDIIKSNNLTRKVKVIDIVSKTEEEIKEIIMEKLL